MTAIYLIGGPGAALIVPDPTPAGEPTPTPTPE